MFFLSRPSRKLCSLLTVYDQHERAVHHLIFVLMMDILVVFDCYFSADQTQHGLHPKPNPNPNPKHLPYHYTVQLTALKSASSTPKSSETCSHLSYRDKTGSICQVEKPLELARLEFV